MTPFIGVLGSQALRPALLNGLPLSDSVYNIITRGGRAVIPCAILTERVLTRPVSFTPASDPMALRPRLSPGLLRRGLFPAPAVLILLSANKKHVAAGLPYRRAPFPKRRVRLQSFASLSFDRFAVVSFNSMNLLRPDCHARISSAFRLRLLCVPGFYRVCLLNKLH